MKFGKRVMVTGQSGIVLRWAKPDEAQGLIEAGKAEPDASDGGVIAKITLLMSSISNDARNDRQSTTSVRVHTHSRAEGFGLKLYLADEMAACGLVGARAQPV